MKATLKGAPIGRSVGKSDLQIGRSLQPQLYDSYGRMVGPAGLEPATCLSGASMLLLVSGIYRTWGQTLALIGTQERSSL